MLLLWDRNFLSYQTISELRQRGRASAGPDQVEPDLRADPGAGDGSYLAKLYRSPSDRRKERDGILVRIIEYTFDDPGRPGSGERHRLLTTLLDERSTRPRR
jgi:hypothetical protein